MTRIVEWLTRPWFAGMSYSEARAYFVGMTHPIPFLFGYLVGGLVWIVSSTFGPHWLGGVLAFGFGLGYGVVRRLLLRTMP